MLGNIEKLPGMHTDSLRSPSLVTFCMVYILLSPSQRVSDRGRDDAFFPRVSPASLAPGQFQFGILCILELTPFMIETIFDRVIKVARPLYRCYLSCEDAFPSPSMKEEWIAVVWSEACAKTGVNSNSLRHDKEASFSVSVKYCTISRVFSLSIAV